MPPKVKVAGRSSVTSGSSVKGRRDAYLEHGAMRTGESLLWILGQSRRWSTRAQAWVVHASPINAAELQSRIGAGSSNVITRTHRPRANEQVQKDSPWALLYHHAGRRRQHGHTNQPAQPPTTQEQNALDSRVYQEHRARQRIASTGTGRVDDTGFAPGMSGIPDWEENDGPYMLEGWDANGVQVRPGPEGLNPIMDSDEGEEGEEDDDDEEDNDKDEERMGEEEDDDEDDKMQGEGVAKGTEADSAEDEGRAQDRHAEVGEDSDQYQRSDNGYNEDGPPVHDAVLSPITQLEFGDRIFHWQEIQRLIRRFAQHDVNGSQEFGWYNLHRDRRRYIVSFGLHALHTLHVPEGDPIISIGPFIEPFDAQECGDGDDHEGDNIDRRVMAEFMEQEISDLEPDLDQYFASMMGQASQPTAPQHNSSAALERFLDE